MAAWDTSSESVKVVLLCVAWYAFSSGNGVVGKLVLSDFPYPMTLSMVQLLSISIYLIPILWLWNVPKATRLPVKYWFTMIMPLVLGKFFSSVSSHISIWKVPVSYAHTGSARGQHVLRVVLCGVWYGSSCGTNIVGKLLLQELPRPCTLTMFHLLTLSLLVQPFVYTCTGQKDVKIARRCWVTFILPLVGGKFLSSYLSLVSIANIPVSFSSTVKATMPLFTVILTRVMLGEKQTPQIYCSLFPIIGGVAIVTVTELSFNLVGMVSALAATMGFAVQNILSKKCLKETGIHHYRLLVLIARISAVCFFPLWLLQDGTQIWNDTSLWNSSHTSRLVALLVIDGFFNFAQNLVAFTVIAMLTPLSYAVANATKRICIITVSLLTLHNPVTFMNAFGMATAIGGVFLYNKAKLDQAEHKRAPPLLPTTIENRLLQNDVSPSHIVFQGSKALTSANGDARTPDMYKSYNGYRIV